LARLGGIVETNTRSVLLCRSLAAPRFDKNPKDW